MTGAERDPMFALNPDAAKVSNGQKIYSAISRMYTRKCGHLIVASLVVTVEERRHSSAGFTGSVT
jgi:hypothetical protein